MSEGEGQGAREEEGRGASEEGGKGEERAREEGLLGGARREGRGARGS